MSTVYIFQVDLLDASGVFSPIRIEIWRTSIDRGGEAFFIAANSKFAVPGATTAGRFFFQAEFCCDAAQAKINLILGAMMTRNGTDLEIDFGFREAGNGAIAYFEVDGHRIDLGQLDAFDVACQCARRAAGWGAAI